MDCWNTQLQELYKPFTMRKKKNQNFRKQLCEKATKNLLT